MILFHLFALTQIFQRISFPITPAQTESDILSAMFSNSTDIVEQSKVLISLFVNTESIAMNYCAETPDDPNPKTGYRKELFQKTIRIVANTDL